MVKQDHDGGSEREADRGRVLSRRGVLMGVGGATVGLGFGPISTQQGPDFRLGGEVEAWRGQEPASIAGQANPTLPLEVGREYTLVWENLDGQPHNVLILDADGNPLVRSEIMSERGATQTVTFTATEDMVRYLCEVHPNTMVGDVTVTASGNGGGGSQPTTTSPPATDSGSDDGAGFFPAGAEVGTRMVAEGMTAPTDFAVPDDGTGRRFVTDQTGQVWTVTDGGRRETPFMDVTDRMVTLGEFNGSYADPTQEYDERGLLGIDVHPEFAANGQFYLHYSAPPDEDTPDGWDHVEVVSEYAVTEDGDRGDPDSERVLLRFQKPQYNHDAGPMAFGPDGYLYVPMGDGGGADDDMYGHVDDWYARNAGGNGQDVVENLLGDVLRIDVDGGGDGEPYGIPEDNPFVGSEGRDEIYAYGFRNPYGISFDGEDNLFIADAGQNLYEEANVVERGGNYGWNVKEGTHCFSTEDPSDPDAITDCPTAEPDEPPYTGGRLIDPVVEFPHTYRGESVGITIIGGHRYEADDIPDLAGKYVFGAWTTDPARAEPAGRILAATPPESFGPNGDPMGTPTETETETEIETETETESPSPDDEQAPGGELWDMEELVVAGGLDYFVRMFGQGPDGEVYVLVNRNGVPEGDTGAVLELVPPEEGESTPTG